MVRSYGYSNLNDEITPISLRVEGDIVVCHIVVDFLLCKAETWNCVVEQAFGCKMDEEVFLFSGGKSDRLWFCLGGESYSLVCRQRLTGFYSGAFADNDKTSIREFMYAKFTCLVNAMEFL